MIGPIDKPSIRLDRAEPAERPAPPEKVGEDAPGTTARPRADRVEISQEGRQAVAHLDQVPGLDPERVARIRQRIADGSYDAPEVLDTVARRMLRRGDV